MKKILLLIVVVITAIAISCYDEDLGCKNSLTDPCFDWAYCNANMYDSGATQELIDWCIERYDLPPVKQLVDNDSAKDTSKVDTLKTDTLVTDTIPQDTVQVDSVSQDTVTVDSLEQDTTTADSIGE